MAQTYRDKIKSDPIVADSEKAGALIKRVNEMFVSTAEFDLMKLFQSSVVTGEAAAATVSKEAHISGNDEFKVVVGRRSLSKSRAAADAEKKTNYHQTDIVNGDERSGSPTPKCAR